MSKKIENETVSIIKRRRSVRNFKSDPIDRDTIMSLLAAANCAPSAHNSQSWKFFVLTGAKKEELAKIVSSGADRFNRPSTVLLRMAAKSIFSAPAVIAVANTGELIKHGSELFKVDKELGTDFFRTMEIQNSAAAVENLLVAATALGVSSVWLGILYLMKHEVLSFLGMPEGEFMAVVPVGYAARESNASPSKRPVEEVVEFLD